MKKDLPFLENLGYYFYVLITLGGAWLIKVIIKKAIIESEK